MYLGDLIVFLGLSKMSKMKIQPDLFFKLGLGTANVILMRHLVLLRECPIHKDT